MAKSRMLADVLQELHDSRESGQLFVNVVESSEDLIRIYLKDGEIYCFSYGSAAGEDAMDIIEYYTLGNATFLSGSTPPAGTATSTLPTERFINMMRKADKKVRVP